MRDYRPNKRRSAAQKAVSLSAQRRGVEAIKARAERAKAMREEEESSEEGEPEALRPPDPAPISLSPRKTRSMRKGHNSRSSTTASSRQGPSAGTRLRKRKVAGGNTAGPLEAAESSSAPSKMVVQQPVSSSSQDNPTSIPSLPLSQLEPRSSYSSFSTFKLRWRPIIMADGGTQIL